MCELEFNHPTFFCKFLCKSLHLYLFVYSGWSLWKKMLNRFCAYVFVPTFGLNRFGAYCRVTTLL